MNMRRGSARHMLALAAGLMLVVAAPSVLRAAAGAQWAEIDAGLRAAEAVRAVKRLQHAYAHYLDAGMWNDAADLFATQATAQFGADAVSGRDGLRRYLMDQAGRNRDGLDAGQLHTHLIMQPIITLGADGRSAKGTWHELTMLGRFGKSAEWTGGIYENDYLLEQGVWKIARLHYYPQYAGDYDAWGHRAPPKWNIPYHFEARHVGVTVPKAALTALARDASAPQPEMLAQLSRRAAALDDETQVRNVQHALGYYFDRKMWDDVADLFAADGSMELASRGTWTGREHIRRVLEQIHGPAPLRRGELFDHIMLATVVTVAPDGTHAAARTTQLAMLGLVGEFARWETGLYENRFVKQDGKWRLTELRYFPRMSTDYDLGWRVDAAPAPGLSADLRPDRKPAQRFASYPAAQSVGLHFPNPVTGKPARTPAGPVVSVSRMSAQHSGKENSTADPAPDAASLQRQIHAAIGVDAVENLMSSYGYYIDESAWDEMADTYGSTGSKEITGAGVYVGPDRIRAILKLRGPAGGRTPNFFTIHQLTQPVIHVAADGLSAKARLRLFQDGGAADGSSGSWIGGIYENTALFENGEWKFGVQDLHHIFNASYRNGWARVGPGVTQLKGRPPSPRDERGGGITQGLGGARSGNRLVDEMPPDRPIRARQYAFPDISEPAFHYVNPVSGRVPAHLMP